MSAWPAAAPTSSAATTTSRGRPTWAPIRHTLSCYYGLAEGAWKHWCRVWGVDYEWIKSRFDMTKQYDAGGGKMEYTMNIPGIPVSRWIDGVLEDKQNISQKDNLRAVIFQGHACNSQTRGTHMKKALEKLDMVVISDPHPTHMAVMSDRKNDTYLLPTCTQYETSGSATASNRALQWREKIIEPLYESLPDHAILYKLAKKLGFANEMFKNIKVREGRARGRRHPSGDQPRRLDDRLHGPEPGAAQTPRQAPGRPSTQPRCGPKAAPARGSTMACPGPAGGRQR